MHRPGLAHLVEHLTVVVLDNFCYQMVAGSIPAVRNFNVYLIFKYLLNAYNNHI